MAFAKYAKGITTMEKALSSPNTESGKKSVYIHVPYCKKICSFCNMRRTINPVPEDYSSIVIEQIKNYGKTEYVNTSEINSVYFGGGTPTALPENQLAEILRAINKNFHLAKTANLFTIRHMNINRFFSAFGIRRGQGFFHSGNSLCIFCKCHSRLVMRFFSFFI